MLSTKCYNEAVNLYVENCKKARVHGNTEEYAKQEWALIRLLSYCRSHGLKIGASQDAFRFVRNGYTPSSLHITIEE